MSLANFRSAKCFSNRLLQTGHRSVDLIPTSWLPALNLAKLAHECSYRRQTPAARDLASERRGGTEPALSHSLRHWSTRQTQLRQQVKLTSTSLSHPSDPRQTSQLAAYRHP
eukprot:584291-Hanusia_phi.AAC.2